MKEREWVHALFICLRQDNGCRCFKMIDEQGTKIFEFTSKTTNHQSLFVNLYFSP